MVAGGLGLVGVGVVMVAVGGCCRNGIALGRNLWAGRPFTGDVISRRLRAGAVALGTVVLIGLLGAVPASALTDFTWTGAANRIFWSDPANWSSNTAPTGSVGNIAFPALGSCGGCYLSEDDIAGLSANELSIDDSAPYQISALQPLTLGAGGIAAAPTAHAVSAPELQTSLVLGAPQTWTIAGGGSGSRAGLSVAGTVSGSSNPLTLSLSNSAEVGLGAVETGTLTVTGSGVLSTDGPSLNATDGNPVVITGGASVVVVQDGTIGPLQLSNGAISVLGGFGGPPTSAGTLIVEGGISLDAASSVSLGVGRSESFGTHPVIDDRAELSATGPVDLGNATLTLLPAGTCPIFSPGQTYTLITTTGSLTGRFGGISDGTIVNLGSNCPGSTQTMQINYSARSATATVVDPGPAPTAIRVATNPSTAVTNEPVTLTATVTADYGTPTGTVSFADNGTPIAGCASKIVAVDGALGTATCPTSFTAASGNAGRHELLASYTPANPSTRASANAFFGIGVLDSITVRQAPTRTVVAASSPSVAISRSVTYTASVTPAYTGIAAPAGTIEFADHGTEIGSCAKQSLHARRGQQFATCTVRHLPTGAHAISAHYGGDPNFAASTSASARVVSWSTQALRRQLRPVGQGAAITALLRHGQLTQHIRAPTNGVLTIRWYRTTIDHHHAHNTLLAAGRVTYRGPATKRVMVSLTPAGRNILKRVIRVRINATAAFSATGARLVTLRLTFSLNRGRTRT